MQLNMQLIDIRLLKANFSLNKDYKGTSKEVPFNPNITVSHTFHKESNDLYVVVDLVQESGDLPFYFNISNGGHFKFSEAPDEKTLDLFSNANCPAIIFPYVRETIADLSRRAGYPPLHLNPINFVELAKQNKLKKKAEKSAPKVNA